VDPSPQRSRDLIALDDALKALEDMDARKVRVIELRFFAGLSVEDTAEALKISVPSVKLLQFDWGQEAANGSPQSPNRSVVSAERQQRSIATLLRR
jgi:hypothetical protein